ncbi:unnamed protein product [Tenebrio molitor]|nr:unnamed protein product [Tenebrio molitor]
MGKSKKKCKSSDEAKPANKPIQSDGNNESEKTQESSAVDMHVDVQGGTVDGIIESQKNIQPSESYQHRQYDDARSREPVAHKEFNRSYGGGSEGRNSTSYNRQRDSSDQEFNNYGKTRRSEPYKRNNYDSGDGRREKKRSSWNENESNRRSARDSNFRRSDRQSYGGSPEDEEFVLYNNEFKRNKGYVEYVKTREITSDLFEMPEEYSLAHCVAEDMNMGAGIAVRFRRDFKKVGELLNQRQRPGGLAILTHKDRFIYYLVTKRLSSGKPTYSTLFSSLKTLRGHVIANDVKKLAMPRIGCGLDRLQWENVKFMIEFVFAKVDVEIVVCNLEPTEESPQQRHRNCKVTYEKYPIQDIEYGTVIVYFSSEDEFVSPEMHSLDAKFHFLREFGFAKKMSGSVIFYTKTDGYLLCGCIVKKTKADPFDFVALQKCLYSIQTESKKRQLYYVAFQALTDEDTCMNHKLVNVMRNSFREVEVYVCCPGELYDDIMAKERTTGYSPRTSLDRSQNWRSFRQESPTGKFNSSKSDNSWDNGMSSLNAKTKTVEADYSGNESKDEIKESQENITVPQVTTSNDNYWSAGNNQGSALEDKLNYSAWSEDTPTPPASQTVYEAGVQPHPMINITENEGSGSDMDKEYDAFEKELKSGKIECSMVKEQETPSLLGNFSKVCFACEDMMTEGGVPSGSDIGPHLGKLLNQRQTEGGVAFAKENNNFLYCLIVTRSTTSPTGRTIFSAIKQLQEHARKNRVKNVSVPQVKAFSEFKMNEMFQYLLGKFNIQVIITPFENNFDASSLKKRNHNKIQHTKSGIHQMSKKSVIIYLASVDGSISEEMTSLSKKFEFIDEFKKKKKSLGDCVKYKENEDHVLYGCIVKSTHGSPVDFFALQKCIFSVNDYNKVDKLPTVGIQAVKDNDESINYKIATVLLNGLENVTIKMCWPGALKDKMPTKNAHN